MMSVKSSSLVISQFIVVPGRLGDQDTWGGGGEWISNVHLCWNIHETVPQADIGTHVPMNVQQWGYDPEYEERLAQYQLAAEYWTNI